MPTGTAQWPRYDWKDPEDRRQMILSGQVWTVGSPSISEAAARECLADPSLINEKTPPDVLSWIEEQKKATQDGWA